MLKASPPPVRPPSSFCCLLFAGNGAERCRRSANRPQSQADQPIERASLRPPISRRVVQKVRSYIQKNPIVQKLQGDGFYPRIGGLSPGSGLAGGAGYRRHLNWAYIDVSGAVSTKAYRGVDATVGWVDTKYVDVVDKADVP